MIAHNLKRIGRGFLSRSIIFVSRRPHLRSIFLSYLNRNPDFKIKIKSYALKNRLNTSIYATSDIYEKSIYSNSVMDRQNQIINNVHLHTVSDSLNKQQLFGKTDGMYSERKSPLEKWFYCKNKS